ncbi:MAG: M48 family metallopeptidase [Deltaproteobacteria bacterium]|nr:M48 family metallopeptidase [Deltaproteobacteria bacterium]
MSVSYYSDARTGQKRNVHIVFAADGIRFVDDCELIISFWSYNGLNVIGAVSRASPFQLKHERFGDSSLTCDDPTVLEHLGQYCPDVAEKLTYPTVRNVRRTIALVVAAISFFYLFALSIRLLAEPISALIPLRWEQALGGQISKRLVEETGVCSANDGVKALDQLTTKLTSVISTQYPFRVRITDDARVNSFAVSGGEIVIFRGMLDQAKTPDEFAGLLAHEVAHTAERHALEGMIRTLGVSFIVSSYLDSLSSLAFSSASLKKTMVQTKFTAANELVADSLSVQILEAAKISPQGSIDLFARLRQGDGTAGSFLSRHDQAGSAMTAALGAKATSPALSKEQWTALKNICSDKVVLHPAS